MAGLLSRTSSETHQKQSSKNKLLASYATHAMRNIQSINQPINQSFFLNHLKFVAKKVLREQNVLCLLKVKGSDIAFHGKSTSELRSVTCSMRSHSVTCHPTQVNAPLLNSSQIGWYLIYLPRRDETLS